MNNLVRCLKTIPTACLWVVIFTAALSNAYAFDNDRLDLTITRFLDSLSFNYKGFDIKIEGVSVGEEFDDNITLAEKDELEDFITKVGLKVGVIYEGKNRTLELIGNINNQTFAKNDIFNNITQDVTLNFTNEFSKYDRMSLKNVFFHSEAPLSEFREEFFEEEQFGERGGGRLDYFKNRFNVNYSRDIAKQLTITTRYANDIDIFSGVDRPSSSQNRAGLETAYSFSPTTIFFFTYDFSIREYEDRGNISINTIATGIRQYITKKLYFDGKTGLDFIDSVDDTSPTRGLIRSSLTYQIDRDLDASVSFQKSNNASSFSPSIFGGWRTSASVTRQMLERLRFSLLAFYGEGKSLSTDFEQKLLGANSTLTYDISKNLKGNLTYSYSQSDPNIESSGYTRSMVFIGLTAGF